MNFAAPPLAREIPMRPLTTVVLAALLALPSLASAQAPDSTAAGTADDPVTLKAGLGHAYGFAGLQAEFHSTRDLSLVLAGGLGPATGRPALAGGLRGRTGGDRHRGLLELSLLPVDEGSAGSVSGSSDGHRQFGLGLQAGYQYTAPSGFTVEVLGGLGYALWGDAAVRPAPDVHPLFGVVLGHTWR